MIDSFGTVTPCAHLVDGQLMVPKLAKLFCVVGVVEIILSLKLTVMSNCKLQTTVTQISFTVLIVLIHMFLLVGLLGSVTQIAKGTSTTCSATDKKIYICLLTSPRNYGSY